MDWSTHHELVNTGESEILRKKERKKEGNALARGSVNWGCDYATALNLEVDPQRSRFRRRESDFALQALTGGRRKRNMSELFCSKLRWHSSVT